ncbi:GntR family transcriptional regulator [Klebsiella pneumoniae]|uniref:GntR family transcriptional regulator n=1 Tax=Klebsiella pneumoniae TaxID=573 RepID=A0A377WHZ8_KLEPN|nr:GntR family transcriptional regulator [Klebsiella pneumoniae]
MLATLFSARAESQGIHIGTGTRFGLEGAFDRYLRLPFTLPDEAFAPGLLHATTAVAKPC